MGREALLIGNSAYDEPELRQLRAPGRDVAELGPVLSHPEVCSFETRTLTDGTNGEIRTEIERFFSDRRPDDLLLLYFSGHGLKDVTGALYLAVKDTGIRDLANTAVTADFIDACIRRSRSRRIILILDCCYSGAFTRGMVVRADQTVHVQERFGGRGLVIITASSATEYAFEDGVLVEETDPRPSVFTRAFIEGLDTGAADLDRDGEITLDEIYDFVFDAVHHADSRQTPCRWVFGAQGRLVLARRRTSSTPVLRSSPAPEPLVLRPPRRLAAVGLVPIAMGSAVVWWGVRWYAWSAMVAGAWLIILGLLMGTAMFTSVELSRDGVRTVPALFPRVRWPSVLAIEVRSTLIARTVAIRRADMSLFHRLVLPAPRTHRLAVNVEFDDQVLSIRRWSERWGSPAPVVTGSRWAGARGALAPLVAVLILILGVDRPWLWAAGPEAERVSRACAVLDLETVREIWPIQLMTGVSEGPDETTPQRSQCIWGLSGAFGIVGPPMGGIELRYDLYTRSIADSGSTLAERQLAEFRRQDGSAPMTIRKSSAQLGGDSYVAVSDTAAIVRARRANVVISVAFSKTGDPLAFPDQAQLENVAVRAADSIELVPSRPG